MKTKHTSGEWRIFEGLGWLDIVSAIDEENQRSICTLAPQGSSDEIKANARLISKAPKMLRLLKRVEGGLTTPIAIDIQTLLTEIEGSKL